MTDESLAEDIAMSLGIAQVLERACDDNLRARYRYLLPSFLGSPPAWLTTFLDGGPLVLPAISEPFHPVECRCDICIAHGSWPSTK
jgi:hypothetical protein